MAGFFRSIYDWLLRLFWYVLQTKHLSMVIRRDSLRDRSIR